MRAEEDGLEDLRGGAPVLLVLDMIFSSRAMDGSWFASISTASRRRARCAW